MGYTTDFEGSFSVMPPLSEVHREYLLAFAGTRRMRRNPELLKDRPDPKRRAVGLSLGVEGGHFVGATGNFGQEHTLDIVSYNSPPEGQPGLWCQWIPNKDGTAIEWDEGEKFYSYVEWLEYLIEEFLRPWGYEVNGSVRWYGEERSDMGVIECRENRVSAKKGRLVYE